VDIRKSGGRVVGAVRRGGVSGRLMVGALVVCLALVGAGLAAVAPDSSPEAATRPVPVPAADLAAVLAGANSCPVLTPSRLAAQIMVASGFGTTAQTPAAGIGIAALTNAQWAEWTPAPDAERSDASANILALAHNMCDLSGRVAAAQVPGDAWRLTLAAYHAGLDAVTDLKGVPGNASSYVSLVAQYAAWYAAQPALANPVPPTVPSTAASTNPATPTGTPVPTATGSPSAKPRPAAAAATSAQQWKLTWSDEFSGAAGSPPDPSKWTHDTGGTGWGNNELEYYTDSTANAALDGQGDLVVTASTNGASSLSCWYGPCDYTSARLNTLGLFSQEYGRFSARIELPQGQGIWPSFWAMGDNLNSVGWPQAGEIDTMYMYGNQTSQIMDGLAGPSYSPTGSDTLPSGAFSGGFHTFSVDWYPDHISFAVDGVVYSTEYRVQAGNGWVFDHPFFLLLNLAVGGNQPGDPNSSTTFPQRMLVDWVRVYQPTPPSTAVTGPVKGFAGKCATAGPTVELVTCHGGATQTWTWEPDGTLRSGGQCLDAGSGPADGSRPVLASCSGAASQKWLSQSNGQIASTASGLCLDVTDNRSADGTPLQLWDCWGATNQTWSVP
jgi:beta-glucanase (GH16 family)